MNSLLLVVPDMATSHNNSISIKEIKAKSQLSVLIKTADSWSKYAKEKASEFLDDDYKKNIALNAEYMAITISGQLGWGGKTEQQNPGFTVLAAYSVQNKVLGIAVATICQFGTQILSMVVDPECIKSISKHERGGIGTKLMQELASRALLYGGAIIDAEALPLAIPFYAKLGFTSTFTHETDEPSNHITISGHALKNLATG
jgi:hypothetical protein